MRHSHTLLLVTTLFLPLSAYARDAKLDAAARERVTKELSCSQKVGREVGNCLRDKLKTSRVLRERFLEDQEQLHTQWHLDNAHLGVGEEYLKVHNAYHKKTNDELRAYDAALRSGLKDLERERQTIVRNTSRRTVPTAVDSKPTTGSKVCYVGTRAQMQKCLRNLLHPRISS